MPWWDRQGQRRGDRAPAHPLAARERGAWRLRGERERREKELCGGGEDALGRAAEEEGVRSGGLSSEQQDREEARGEARDRQHRVACFGGRRECAGGDGRVRCDEYDEDTGVLDSAGEEILDLQSRVSLEEPFVYPPHAALDGVRVRRPAARTTRREWVRGDEDVRVLLIVQEPHHASERQKEFERRTGQLSKILDKNIFSNDFPRSPLGIVTAQPLADSIS
ncbi:hypothetical protein B0H10DRAFT_2361926 [Mycena sp. CBHHK59/15]|nr:hypothetical protein B0H10DRAFT_2361926 [Mycena sp. CBHHK59/15]